MNHLPYSHEQYIVHCETLFKPPVFLTMKENSKGKKTRDKFFPISPMNL